MQRCPKCGQSLPLDEYPPSSRGKNGAWCRSCHRLAKCGPPRRRCCDWCMADMEVTTRRAGEARVYCSRACKDDHRNEMNSLWRRLAKPERTCVHCGETLAQGKRSDASFCTQRCEQAAHNATRKASARIGARQAGISRAQIVARDASTCHLCGKVCEPQEIHLDHVVPLARGGTHEADNLAVACATCNLSKGARVAA